MEQKEDTEFVIFIPNLEAWEYVEQWPNPVRYREQDKYWNIIAKANQYVWDRCSHLQLTGIYFGNEVCEELIPNLNDILECYRRCIVKQLELTLVTPLVTDVGIQKLDALFHCLEERDIVLEVVFNDWGVGKLLETKYPKWKKRMGRTLDKMIREPRFTASEYEKLNVEILNFMQEPAAFSESYLAVLTQLNVQAVELDCVPQGYRNMDCESVNQSVQKSIYFPFYCVTSGRLCMMKAMGRTPEQKWNLDEPCTRLCQKYNQVMQKFMLRDGKKKKLKLLRKGNSVFGYNMDLRYLELRVWDRFVWQPIIPL